MSLFVRDDLVFSLTLSKTDAGFTKLDIVGIYSPVHGVLSLLAPKDIVIAEASFGILFSVHTSKDHLSLVFSVVREVETENRVKVLAVLLTVFELSDETWGSVFQASVKIFAVWWSRGQSDET